MPLNGGNSELNVLGDAKFGGQEFRTVFHGTEKRNVPSILKEGIKPTHNIGSGTSPRVHVTTNSNEADEYGDAKLHINANHQSLNRPRMSEYHRVFKHPPEDRTQFTTKHTIPPEAIKNIESNGRRVKEGPLDYNDGF